LASTIPASQPPAPGTGARYHHALKAFPAYAVEETPLQKWAGQKNYYCISRGCTAPLLGGGGSRGRSRNLKKGGSSGIFLKRGGGVSNHLLGAICIGNLKTLLKKGGGGGWGVRTAWTPPWICPWCVWWITPCSLYLCMQLAHAPISGWTVNNCGQVNCIPSTLHDHFNANCTSTFTNYVCKVLVHAVQYQYSCTA
jgi:hypothetical protein